jgi:hypothetical protein
MKHCIDQSQEVINLIVKGVAALAPFEDNMSRSVKNSSPILHREFRIPIALRDTDLFHDLRAQFNLDGWAKTPADAIGGA